MVLGKHSGRRALAHRLKELGFALDAAELDAVYHRFNELADRRKAIFDQDLLSPAAGTAAGRPLRPKPCCTTQADSHGSEYELIAMKLKVLVCAGDGIGPEVTREAVRVLISVAEFGGYDFQFTEMPIGGAAIRQTGTPLPAATLDAALESDAVLLGAVGGNEFNALPPDRRPEAGLAAASPGAGGFCQSASRLCLQGFVRQLAAAP